MMTDEVTSCGNCGSTEGLGPCPHCDDCGFKYCRKCRDRALADTDDVKPYELTKADEALERAWEKNRWL